MLTLKSLHLPIAMKAVLLIVALGLLSVAANVSCLERLDALDKLNAVVTRHLAPARLVLSKPGRRSSSASRPIRAVRPRTPTRPTNAEEIEGYYAAAKRALNNVLTYYPAWKATSGAFSTTASPA